MNFRCLLLAAAGCVVFHPVTAQSLIPIKPGITESLIESVGSDAGAAIDYEEILNDLENLQKNPLNLNNVDKAALQKLPFLTDFQITSFLEYREENGKLLTIYELQVIVGFTDEVIKVLLPYVTVSNQEQVSGQKLSELKSRGNHEVVIRTQRNVEMAAGYDVFDSTAGSTRYPGNPWLINAKYGFEIKDQLRVGLTVEKDPGEDFFKRSNPKGFDFNSAFVMVNDLGSMKSAVLGDYRLAFGQGLTLWNGAVPGKSSLTMNIIKRQDAIKAFTSADENNFFRGAAAALTWGKITFTGFYSSKRRDANITDTLPSGRIYFSSFQESGYHRTQSEVADEKSVREIAYGGNLVFRNNLLKVGSTLVQYKFDKYVEAGDELKDIHTFTGNKLLNWGIDYSVNLNEIQLFGETAYGSNYWATLNGVLIHVNKYASFSLLYRNYGAGYFSLHSAAFSEGSSDSNEEGFYAGLVIHPAAKWKVSGYADFYRFPWLRFRVSAPAHGSDYLLQVDYSPNRNMDMYLRIKYESDPEDNLQDLQPIPEIDAVQHTGVRYHLSYQLNEKLALQNRIEIIRVNPAKMGASKGILVYQDVEFRAKRLPAFFDFRIAWFNTGGYDSRIYAYEQDMAAGFSFSPLYGKGCRTYLMIRYDATRRLSCRVRLSQTNFFNITTIGSGYDRIDANTRSDIKFQLVARF